MRIGVSRLQGLVVLCCGSEAARAAARQLIAAADPSAQRVPMCKLLKLHADLALDGFEMRLAGTSRPFVAASHVLISGTAAVARQATAPPQTREVGGAGGRRRVGCDAAALWRTAWAEAWDTGTRLLPLTDADP
jgi:hypothetical protein